MGVFRCTRVFLLAVCIVAFSAASFAEVFISVGFAPPPLPVYAQPPCPAAGYIWTPGYWAYGPDGYYWVPGTWVVAPVVGYLWTPDIGAGAAALSFGTQDIGGPQVGFYGGVNYGFGYTGYGYQGGYWQRNRQFYYNRTVNNVNNINNVHVYNRTVVNDVNRKPRQL